VGPTRGENQCDHTRAKETTKNNDYHGVLEGHSRNEDSIDRVENSVDKEARKKNQIGTPPRTSNIDDCTVGGRKEKYGTGTDRGCNIHTGGDNSIVIGGANKKSYANEVKRKGTSRKVPKFE
jgi:hypothetical protein